MSRVNRLSRLSEGVFVALVCLTQGCSRDVIGPAGDPDALAGLPDREIAVVITSDPFIELGFRDEATIVAQVRYADDGSPAEGISLSWAFSGDPVGSAIDAATTVTEADGRSRNRVIAGESRGTFDVVAWTLQVDGETKALEGVPVKVDGIYAGQLRVEFSYNDIVPLSDIDTRVHRGTIDCSAVDYDTLPLAEQEQVAGAVADRLVFDSLMEAAVYSLTAVAYGPAGNPVAFGCTVADEILGHDVVQASVPLLVAPSVLETEFSFGTPLDLSEALPPGAQSVLASIEDFLSDPAAALTGYVFDFLGIADANLVDTLTPLLEGLISSGLPAWTQNAFTVGEDLLSLITDLRVGGRLSIDSAASHTAFEGRTFDGHWQWTDFLWQWRAGCDPSAACCGRTTFSGADIGMAPIGADITGVAERVDDNFSLVHGVSIDEHTLSVQVGVLVLFALENMVLPALTGETSTECAVESFMGCAGAGEFLCSAPLSSANADPCGCPRVSEWAAGFGLDPVAVDAGCQLAVGAGVDLLRGYAQQLTFDGTNEYSVSAGVVGHLIDEDLDLRPDSLSAHMDAELVAGSFRAPLAGAMVGDRERLGCSTNAQCGAGDICQLRPDMLNDCAGNLRCVRQVGDVLNGQTCGFDGDCSSGLCLDAGTCFGACEVDTDCSGGQLCATTDVRMASGSVASTFSCTP